MKKDKKLNKKDSNEHDNDSSKVSFDKNMPEQLRNKGSKEIDIEETANDEFGSSMSYDDILELLKIKKEINILAIDPRETYVANLGYFIRMFKEEMSEEGIKVHSYKFRRSEDLKITKEAIIYDIFILNLRVGPTGFSENEIRVLREKKIASLNNPFFILFVPTKEMKWELRHYSPIGEIIDLYLDILPSYSHGETCLREALIMILKEKKILNSKYLISEKRMIELYGTLEEEFERIEKENFGGKLITEMEEDGEQIPEEEFVT